MAATASGEIIVEEHLGLVHAFARRFVGRGIDYEDLYGAGCVGLVKAANAYDPSRGTAFSTYAVPVILGEIKRLFRDDGTVKVSRKLKDIYLKANREREKFYQEHSREPTIFELSEAMSISPEELSEALSAGAPPMSLTMQDFDNEGEDYDIPAVSFEDDLVVKLALQKALDTLDTRDRELIALRYQRGFSQQVTAQILGMTQVQVSRRERKILEQIRTKLK